MNNLTIGVSPSLIYVRTIGLFFTSRNKETDCSNDRFSNPLPSTAMIKSPTFNSDFAAGVFGMIASIPNPMFQSCTTRPMPPNDSSAKSVVAQRANAIKAIFFH